MVVDISDFNLKNLFRGFFFGQLPGLARFGVKINTYDQQQDSQVEE